MDLHYADRPHGHGSQHWYGTLYQRDAASSATLRHSFAQDRDLLNPEVAASYSQTVKGMQYQGKSEQEAEQMAAMSAKGSVQVQATLSAVKEMSGWTFYSCMACAVFFLLFPWRKRKLEPYAATVS